jgi:F-type H+-transporting ATPase subunit b
MIILTLISNLPLGNGFGFNTNILETNIINLAVVIAVVVSFVGDALRSLLETRKQTILNNLREADQRAIEAQEKLSQAQTQLELSKKKAAEIREQGMTTAEQDKLQTIRQAENDVQRLEELKNETISLQQQKALGEISKQLITLAFNTVREKFKNPVRSSFHIEFNNLNIIFFTSYKPN